MANGTSILDGVDQRSNVARRYREIAAAVIDSLPPDRRSEVMTHMARGFAGLICLRESLDRRLLNEEDVDIAVYTKLTNSAGRAALIIGTNRHAHDVTRQLFDMLEGKNESELEAIESRINRHQTKSAVKLTTVAPDMPDDGNEYAKSLELVDDQLDVVDDTEAEGEEDQ